MTGPSRANRLKACPVDLLGIGVGSRLDPSNQNCSAEKNVSRGSPKTTIDRLQSSHPSMRISNVVNPKRARQTRAKRRRNSKATKNELGKNCSNDMMEVWKNE